DSRDDHVPGPDVLRPCRIDGLEGVLREHLRVGRPQVLACDDVVRRDVVAERPHAALESGLHDRYAFRGSVISPWIAEAVTVHGLARYTCAVGEPIRPGYFRFVEDMQISSPASVPMWLPNPGPPLGDVDVAPGAHES